MAETEDGSRIWVAPDARPHFRVRVAGPLLDAPLLEVAQSRSPRHDPALLGDVLASE